MKPNNENTVDKLIETLRDGEEGFQTAAEKISDSSIKSQFMDFAGQRRLFVTQLSKYSDTKSTDSTKGVVAKAAGSIHRGWIDLKSALGGGDKSILNEAERGEDFAVSAYKDAMNATLPQDLATLVRDQFTTVKATHDKVKNLRDSL